MSIENEKTIMVDGVSRSRELSSGRPIADTDDKIRDFWRWFGDSKMVDQKGRPIDAHKFVEDIEEDFHVDAPIVPIFKSQFKGASQEPAPSGFNPNHFFEGASVKNVADHNLTIENIHQRINIEAMAARAADAVLAEPKKPGSGPKPR